MKQKLLLILALLLMAFILIGLNAATYTQRQKEPESEMDPNRSSFNPGPTGTQAFYTMLNETGRKVTRWQEPTDSLLLKRANTPKTFVVIGPIRRKFKDGEYSALLRWVSSGGRLVIVDREPPDELVKTTASWTVAFKPSANVNIFGADPSDPRSMTEKTPAAKPAQPSLFTYGVNAVQTSKFASSVSFGLKTESKGSGLGTGAPSLPPPPSKTRVAGDNSTSTRSASNNGTVATRGTPPAGPVIRANPNSNSNPAPEIDPDDEDYDEDSAAAPPPAPAPAADKGSTPANLVAPVTHVTSGSDNIVVDVAYGYGRIVFVTDPYILANGGVSLADNAQLGANIVNNGDGVIAFDEYHQGYGGNKNRMLEFFAGTPVVAIFFQIALLIGLVFVSRSRRFGRALPSDEPDRLSKLEYVGAMAEMQQRTRSFDLAIENIYRDFRRRAARLLGVDNTTIQRQQFAVLIAERVEANRNEVDELMFECEEIIAGEPTNKREVLELTTRIRKLEQALGLRRRTSK